MRSSVPVLAVGCSAFVVLDIRLEQGALACANTEVQVELTERLKRNFSRCVLETRDTKVLDKNEDFHTSWIPEKPKQDKELSCLDTVGNVD